MMGAALPIEPHTTPHPDSSTTAWGPGWRTCRDILLTTEAT